jgi:hypothetical protein
MKKIFLLLMLLLIAASTIFSQTEGILSVTVTTAPTGIEGKSYAPRNCVAIWIEDPAGKFVKTLLVYGQIRINQLQEWGSATMNSGFAFDRTDAITGATNMSHDSLQCAWDGSDFNGRFMPDGKYKLMMELTDRDGKGNAVTWLFTKGRNKEILTPADEISFKNIKAVWNPM